MHNYEIGKDHACASGDILVYRQTCASPYFVTVPTGKVKITSWFLLGPPCIQLQRQNLQWSTY